MRKRKLAKKRLVMEIIGLVVSLVLILAGTLVFLKASRIDVIPDKYMIYLYIAGVVLLLFVILLLIPKVNWILKIIISILCLIISFLCIFMMGKIDDTLDFFKSIQAKDYEVEKYYVLVLNESPYKKIIDIKDKSIGIYPTKTTAYDRAISILDEKVKTNKSEYDDLYKLYTDLKNKKVESILLSDAYKDALEEEYSNFNILTRVLETIEVKTELDNITKEAVVTEQAFNIYISGIDTYGSISTKSRSDVNIIMTVNPMTHQILLTSIPRDYYVQLHGTTGLKDKLTHAGVHGINMSIQTLEDLLGIDINYYFRVNFNTLIKVVDVLGGIQIDSDAAFTPWTDHNCPIVKGVQTLDGKCTLAFARERHAYATGDRHRGENQQQVISKIIDKLTSSRTLISKYSDILKSLDGSFQTSMSTKEIYSLIKLQLDDMPRWNVNSISLNGSGSMTYTYSYPKQKLYVMVPNQKTVTDAKTKIENILTGKTVDGVITNTAS